jgi:hypothetical protein
MADGRKSGGEHESPGPAHSKAQWRWMYATKKPWAHAWAEQVVAERGPKTGYRSLPEKKTASARRGK